MCLNDNKITTYIALCFCIPLGLTTAINISFDQNYFLLEFRGNTKKDSSARDYSFEDVKNMVSVASTRFSTLITETMGVYDVDSGWDEGNPEALVPKAASVLNVEKGALGVSVIIGAKLHKFDSNITEKEILHAFAATADANTRFNGTVKTMLINMNRVSLKEAIRFVNRTLQDLPDSLQLGLNSDECENWIGDKDVADLLSLVEVLRCFVGPDSFNFPSNEVRRVGAKLLRFREKALSVNRNLEFMGGTLTSSWNEQNYSDLVEYWILMAEWAKNNTMKIAMHTAFDMPNPAEDWGRHCGWWKIIGNDISNSTSFVEKFRCETQSCSVTVSEVTTKGIGDILFSILGSLSIIVIVVGILVYKRWPRFKNYLSSQRGESLEENEIQPTIFTNAEYKSDIAVETIDEEIDMGDEVALRYPFDEDFEIPMLKIKLDMSQLLGKGAFGTVYKGYIEGRNGELAFKIMERGASEADFNLMLTEVKVMIRVGIHAHVMSIIGACTEEIQKGKIIIATDLCENGCLEKYLRDVGCDIEDNKETKKSFVNECLRWCYEIALGMEHIASRNVVHADLATRNVLLTKDMSVKITDFGLSRHLYAYTNYIKKNQEPLPWRWLAIESLKNLCFSTKSDTWSFGVTLWEIFSFGAVPYPGLSWNLNFPQALTNGLRLNKPELATKQMYNLMLNCWKIEPDERPSFKDLTGFLLLSQKCGMPDMDLTASNEVLNYTSLEEKNVPDFQTY